MNKTAAAISARAILPLKDLRQAKSRLAGVLPARARRRLAAGMAEDALAALNGAAAVDTVLLVSDDPNAAALARKHGAAVLSEAQLGCRGLNPAMAAAVAHLEGNGPILIMHGDLPLAKAGDIDAFLEDFRAQDADVLIAPDRAGDGSNLMVFRAGAAPAFRYGPGSCAAHMESARQRGLRCALHHNPRLAFDVDTPEDLRLLRKSRMHYAAPRTAPRTAPILSLLKGLENGALSAEHALALAEREDALQFTPQLCQAAARLRDEAHPSLVTYSRKLFLPLTQLCRDVCHYCTFAQTPRALSARRLDALYMSDAEVLGQCRAAEKAGCKEALFTLGERPELRYRAARDALAELGFASTLKYVAHIAGRVLEETSLLPHINAGCMDDGEFAMLRPVSASMGIMLESASERLCRKGMPHHGSPDKTPARRLETIERAGRHRVPFTSGILIGIGETRRERVEALLLLRRAHERHGHLQEIIIQNFRAKPGTRMAGAAEPALEELLWTVAVARLLFGAEMNIQAPPNLSPGVLPQLVAAGINDWGGVSPVTPDYVNPEAPWPQLGQLARETAAAGKTLHERLTIYPAYANEGARWLDEGLRGRVLRMVDAEGYPRTDDWCPGKVSPPPKMETLFASPDSALISSPALAPVSSLEPAPERLSPSPVPSPTPEPVNWIPACAGMTDDPEPANWIHPVLTTRDAGITGPPEPAPVAATQPAPPTAAVRRRPLEAILRRCRNKGELSEADLVRLFQARGAELGTLCRHADELRKDAVGDGVSFVVNRNINYTNVCYFKCRFCAFSKGKLSENLRGRPYRLDAGEIARRCREAWRRGATEVCMQGGIHPEYTGQTYLDILATVREAAPGLHIHAFSPLEVRQGAATLGLEVEAFLARLKAAGLSTLPGTAAEILDDEVRRIICPDKLTTAEWLQVMECAHRLGLRSTATIMYGHVEQPVHWARHLLAVRDLQRKTGGFTEFVPLPFVAMEAPLFLKGGARMGPTFREALLMHAVARLALHGFIPNIQASWVKLGREGVAACLRAGVNDVGGTLMNESITRAAGAGHGQEWPPEMMEELIRDCGRQPWQRTTTYQPAPAERQRAARNAAPLEIPVNTPAAKYERGAATALSEAAAKDALIANA